MDATGAAGRDANVELNRAYVKDVGDQLERLEDQVTSGRWQHIRSWELVANEVSPGERRGVKAVAHVLSMIFKNVCTEIRRIVHALRTGDWISNQDARDELDRDLFLLKDFFEYQGQLTLGSVSTAKEDLGERQAVGEFLVGLQANCEEIYNHLPEGDPKQYFGEHVLQQVREVVDLNTAGIVADERGLGVEERDLGAVEAVREDHQRVLDNKKYATIIEERQAEHEKKNIEAHIELLEAALAYESFSPELKALTPETKALTPETRVLFQESIKTWNEVLPLLDIPSERGDYLERFPIWRDAEEGLMKAFMKEGATYEEMCENIRFMIETSAKGQLESDQSNAFAKQVLTISSQSAKTADLMEPLREGLMNWREGLAEAEEEFSEMQANLLTMESLAFFLAGENPQAEIEHIACAEKPETVAAAFVDFIEAVRGEQVGETGDTVESWLGWNWHSVLLGDESVRVKEGGKAFGLLSRILVEAKTGVTAEGKSVTFQRTHGNVTRAIELIEMAYGLANTEMPEGLTNRLDRLRAMNERMKESGEIRTKNNLKRALQAAREKYGKPQVRIFQELGLSRRATPLHLAERVQLDEYIDGLYEEIPAELNRILDQVEGASENAALVEIRGRETPTDPQDMLVWVREAVLIVRGTSPSEKMENLLTGLEKKAFDLVAADRLLAQETEKAGRFVSVAQKRAEEQLGKVRELRVKAEELARQYKGAPREETLEELSAMVLESSNRIVPPMDRALQTMEMYQGEAACRKIKASLDSEKQKIDDMLNIGAKEGERLALMESLPVSILTEMKEIVLAIATSYREQVGEWPDKLAKPLFSIRTENRTDFKVVHDHCTRLREVVSGEDVVEKIPSEVRGRLEKLWENHEQMQQVYAGVGQPAPMEKGELELHQVVANRVGKHRENLTQLEEQHSGDEDALSVLAQMKADLTRMFQVQGDITPDDLPELDEVSKRLIALHESTIEGLSDDTRREWVVGYAEICDELDLDDAESRVRCVLHEDVGTQMSAIYVLQDAMISHLIRAQNQGKEEVVQMLKNRIAFWQKQTEVVWDEDLCDLQETGRLADVEKRTSIERDLVTERLEKELADGKENPLLDCFSGVVAAVDEACGKVEIEKPGFFAWFISDGSYKQKQTLLDECRSILSQDEIPEKEDLEDFIYGIAALIANLETREMDTEALTKCQHQLEMIVNESWDWNGTEVEVRSGPGL